MRRILAVVLAILSLFAFPNLSKAGDTADITAYVKIQKLSVDVCPTSYNFGVIVPGGVEVASSYIAVTSDGNVTERFKLWIPQESNGTWISVTAGTVDAEEYRLSAIFKDSTPLSDDYGFEDSFSVSTERIASSADLARNADLDGEKGFNVAKDNWRKLWFKFEAPSFTEIITQQSITVRVTATPD